MQISGAEFGSGGVTLSVTVTNTGEREGKEVVQLYVSDKASSVTVPAIEDQPGPRGKPQGLFPGLPLKTSGCGTPTWSM